VLVIQRIKEIHDLEHKLLRTNKDSPFPSIITSFFPKRFGVILTHAAFVFGRVFILVDLFFKFIVFDANEVTDCSVALLSRGLSGEAGTSSRGGS
jgi:hypothetical protein